MFQKEKIFVIAEVAGAHEGDLNLMKRLIEIASEANVDAVKFQIFRADELVTKDHPKYKGFKQKEFSEQEWLKIGKYAKNKDLIIMADVFDNESVDIARQIGTKAYKIHSTNLSNPFLLHKVAETKKSVMLGVGGSTKKEIEEAIEILKNNGTKEIALVAGFQSFPTKLEESNLNQIEYLKKEFQLPVGYADHCDAESKMVMILPLLAIAKGASFIEKHFTDDRSKKGTDYYSALNPEELKQLVIDIKKTEKTFGRSDMNFSKDEIKYRDMMKKFIVARTNIKKGEVITLNKISFKRTTKKGMFPKEAQKIVSKKTKRDIKRDELIMEKDIKKKVAILIAARMKSKRLPQKCMLKIEDQPMICHIIDRMKQSKEADVVVLCTSENPNDRILIKQAIKKRIPYVTGSEDDVMARFLQAAETVNADVIVRVTGDNPLTSPSFIDNAIKYHIKTSADYTSTTELPQGTKGEVINVSALKKAHELAENPRYSEYMTWYFTDNSKFFKIEKAPVEDDIRRPKYRLTVDTPEDLKLMREVYKRLYKSGSIIPLEKAIRLLDKNPELLEINAHIKSKDVKDKVNVKLRRK
ncbi:hypothetical protein A3K72_01050 [Candidatus Woesearchaeota archaeon RBG_13_36_6]|nr:MAG: hypothetical protein A3K72_01050 [Candidatus Woesearchaeota archaeon RBG_13_36_6]